jgi:hypothetical protein
MNWLPVARTGYGAAAVHCSSSRSPRAMSAEKPIVARNARLQSFSDESGIVQIGATAHDLILRSIAQRCVSKDGPQHVRVAHHSAGVTPRDRDGRFAASSG